VYVRLMLLCTVWLGVIGFIDDYLKIKARRISKAKGIAYKKTNADGLAGKFKIFGQVILGIIIGTTLYFNPNVVVKREIIGTKTGSAFIPQRGEHKLSEDTVVTNGEVHRFVTVKTPITTIPFVKTHEFNYAKLLPQKWEDYTYILYILVVIFIVTAVSNGANITDGLDGLATGVSAIIGICLGVFVFVSGDARIADYLNIMYIPNLSELSIFVAAFVGACVGFLWYNAYPAQVFMGDTGSLAIGGIIAVFAIAIRKELLIPILCGIFLVENVSVILQVYYFKYQKKKHGLEFAKANRLFKMAPLHHHYQKVGFHESKIVMRFFIIGIMLAVLTIVTLKLR
jgi:phospho-N-acetylmuramoyl-pentapeptide-transferase